MNTHGDGETVSEMISAVICLWNIACSM